MAPGVTVADLAWEDYDEPAADGVATEDGCPPALQAG